MISVLKSAGDLESVSHSWEGIVSHQYRKQTREMLEDLFDTLESRGRIDPQFLGKVRELSAQKKLDKRSHVKQTIQFVRDSFDASR